MPDLDGLFSEHRSLWLTIGLVIGLLVTLEAVQEAIEGAWPHQRRPATMAIGERRAHPLWAIVALLIVPGGLLLILTLAVMTWQDTPRSDELLYGGIMLGIAWVLFLVASIDRLRLRRLITSAGPVAPMALAVVLIVADILLLIAFADVRPSWESVRDALPSIR